MTMTQGPVWRGFAAILSSSADSSFSICGMVISRSGNAFFLLCQLNVAAEFLAHGAQELFRKGVLLAGAEAGEQRRRQNIDRHGLFEGRCNGPASFARILNKAGVTGERGIFRQGHGGKIQQPGGNYAAPPPDFGNIGEVELVAKLGLQLLGSGVAKNVKAFGVSLHQTVFNSVM